jgi:selenide,water dikinase
MTTLNRGAGIAMRLAGARAATDVTGFGLLGHLSEMVAEGGLDAEIEAGSVPLLPGARALAEQGIVPGGTRRNLDALAERVVWSGGIDEVTRLLLADAQTSGGLLIAVPPERLDDLLENLREQGTLRQSVIGRLAAGNGRIHVRD